MQTNWQLCGKCQGMFFGGNPRSACPAGGTHAQSGSGGGYALGDSAGGQAGWQWCGQCQGLFFAGHGLGTCPAHSADGSGNYVLTDSHSDGQAGWKWCGKCQGLFFAVGTAGVCAAGGAHDDSASGSYSVPLSGSGQPGWKWCGKCQGLFFAARDPGGCPAGGGHDGNTSGDYVVSDSGAGQPGWSWCSQCQGLFFGGNSLGACPVPRSHTDAGSGDYVLPTSGAGLSGWQWCSRCQGFFLAQSSNGVCPSRAGSPGNQPGSHDGSASGSYALALLGSNANYIMSSNCKPLINVAVTIDVTQDIVCRSSSGSVLGFSFQLNAYSPGGQKSAWQQYFIILWGNGLIGGVDNWPLSGDNIINEFFDMGSLPELKIPAGYKLEIILKNDSQGNITGATYIVVDNHGVTKADRTINLESISGVTSTELAPIIAFELDLVGPVNGASAVLSAGAGTITYRASPALSAMLSTPSCAESGYITAETANSFYGMLPASASDWFTQTFFVNEVSTAAPMIRKPGKPRPSTHR